MGRPVVHFEIGCRDRDNTRRFFAELFDWRIGDEQPAAMIDTGAAEGIQGHITALGHEPHNYVTIYVQVDDLHACLKKAEELGGKTVIPPLEVPQTGHFAWMHDPEGNLIGLWKPIKA